ncbi:MAG: phage Season12 [Pseudomonadota bacterium]|jgi:hypothetical protein
MAGNIYDTTTLLEVLRVTKTPSRFWLQFFNRQINFDTEDVAFDKVFVDDRKLAPFVVPNVQGRVMGMEGYETYSFKPAYVKPKHVVDPNMVIPRMAGETLGSGSMSPEQRRNAVIAELLRRHRVMHENRWEWMAAQAIITGKVVVKGEDYPEVTVDFRRHASLTGTLSGAAKWDQSTANPLNDLKIMRVNAHNRSGARVQRHIFGADAWDMLTQRVNLKDMMDVNYRGGYGTNVSLMLDGLEGIEYVGTIVGSNGGGRLECYVNTAKYIDPDTGNEEFFLDQKTVVGVSEAVQGVRCFGAIKDRSAGYRPLPLFPKNWENEDPSVEYLMTQGAPLMVPGQPDATYSIKVAT